MKIPHFLLASFFALSLLLFAAPVWAADQTIPGAGNATAIDLAQKSPLVQTSQNFLVQQAKQIQDGGLKVATLDAINNVKTCVTHRARLDDSKKSVIVQQLQAAGLLDPADETTFPGGYQAGVFPPVLKESSGCPQLPQRFYSAPGSAFSSHHSYPGGLVVHESFNDISDLSFATNYRKIYGQSRSDGLPIINPAAKTSQDSADIFISQDVITAAPLWHDWAKPIVFQWNADGTEFLELNIGGNGKTDLYGAPGDSRTGGHHIISLAESMRRDLSPDFVITQASAHSAPTLGNEYKVVNWLTAAAIVAQIDPIAQGYLFLDSQKRLRLPPLRKLGEVSLTESLGSENLLAEYSLHNLSDADFNLTIPAVTLDQNPILTAIAADFGYNPMDTANYNNKFRNPVLSYFSAERLLIIYGNTGLNGVKAEVNKLRQQGII